MRLGRGGRLSVAVVSTAKYFAPRLIAAFVAEHPKLELKFLIGNRDETIALLRTQDADVALAGRPPADLAVEKALIGPHPYVIIAPPTHRLAGKRGLKRDALAGEAFLFRERAPARARCSIISSATRRSGRRSRASSSALTRRSSRR